MPGGDPPKAKVPNETASRYLPLICAWDCLAQVVSFFALVWAGSALYQLVYSSILIVTAALRHFLLGKKLSLQQWMACIIVTSGLFLSSLGMNNGSKGLDP